MFEGCLCVMGLPDHRCIDSSQVDYVPWVSGLLADDVHPDAPSRRRVRRDTLYDSYGYVSLELLFNLLHPVCWYRRGPVDCYRYDVVFDYQTEWGKALH